MNTAAPTPAPWAHDDTAWMSSYPGTIRSPHAPRAIDISDATAERTLDRAVFFGKSGTIAKAICILRNILPALEAGTVHGKEHQEAIDALETIGSADLLVGEQRLDGDMTIEQDPNPLEQGSRRLFIRIRTPKGRIEHRLLGIVARGDGSDGAADAQLIASLPRRVADLLAQTTPLVHWQTVIDGKSVLIDADARALIEAGNWKIKTTVLGAKTLYPQTVHEIVNAKTGQALADALMGVNSLNHTVGVTRRARPIADFDLRRHLLVVHDRRKPTSLNLCPKVIEAIDKGNLDVNAALLKAIA